MAPTVRTISIGGATYDLFLRMDPTTDGSQRVGENLQFPIGSKIAVGGIVEGCGGGASNTAVGLSRLGFAASFCGVVGEDQWGQNLIRNMTDQGVDVTSATIVEGETSSFSLVLLLPSGERTILYHAGVNEHLHDTTFRRDALKDVDAVFLNHLCERSCMIEDDIELMLRENTHAKLFWNPGGHQIATGMQEPHTRALLRRTHLLILNKEEAQAFANTQDVRAAMRIFLAAGAANVCVTDGSNGALGSDGTAVYACPTPQGITVVDATGAGDAFGTGATWGLLTGKSLPESMIAGTLNATNVIRTMGAQAGLLTQEEMQMQRTAHPLLVTRLDTEHAQH